MSFEVSTETREPSVAIVRFAGQFDFSRVSTARAEINQAIEQGAQLIVVNLNDLEYIDSAGLGVLVGTLARLRDRQGELAVVCRTPRIRRVFEITRLTQLVTLHDTEEEALARRAGVAS